ncbi:hypothetical protein PENSPDRAFT_669248 [Peniophora sp. CONT]|nr:hypothetical protein PENSPDRAFT_669248 [Peniophora sp. CONT]
MPPHPAPVSATTPSGKQPVLNDYDKLWDNALERYKKETGKSLRKHSSAQDFLSKTRSADEIIAQFEEQNESFVAFRDSGAKIRGVLKPVVDVVLFLKENAEGASVSVTTLIDPQRDRELTTEKDAIPGGDKIFGAIGVLLQNILVDALVQVFVSLAIATKYCIKSNSWFKRVVRILFRRGSKFHTLLVPNDVAYNGRKEDYFLVLTDQDDVKEVLTELEKLAVDEVQFVIAETADGIRLRRSR